MAAPLINGVRHSWADVRINLLGRVVTGVSSISYDDTQKKENLYGAGMFPSHRGNGIYEAKASIELFQFEVVAIQDAIAPGRLQAIPPFDITVSYLPTGADKAVTDIIRDVQFVNNIRTVKQGDTMSKVALELIVSVINWGAKTKDSTI